MRIRETRTKAESTVSRRRADQLVQRGGVEILKDAKAVDNLGRPLPPTTPEMTAKSKEQAR
ncbi:hypothetical protein ACQEVC_45500 [Plantactinospora sp. CA-294935]|uniref:hypothetical protein n=1 Tax=Plantactinospora sp. CA-294935 TaxID=3240012 RepID=UPI003D8EB091